MFFFRFRRFFKPTTSSFSKSLNNNLNNNISKMMVMLLLVPGWIRRVPQDHQYRQYLTLNQDLPPQTINQFDTRLKLVFEQLDSIAPRFPVPANDIHILTVPSEFYQMLKDKILKAKKRVFLLLLYIGKSQVELVQVIDDALTSNPDLEVHILTDALRGTREAPEHFSLASLLVLLVEKHGKHRVNIRMFHTPHLHGIAKLFVPRRINESWGLQHMKLYGFDDEIILLGANLLEDYFTDRQDRYYLFHNQDLTDYYYEIHSSVSKLLYQLLPLKKKVEGFRLLWPSLNALCEPHINKERFILDSSHLLEPILKAHTKNVEHNEETDTLVYAVSQFTPLLHPGNDVSTEKPAILRLLSYLDLPKIKWWFTAGYFNMLPQIRERLINAKAEGVVITAAPQANLFYKLPGLLYYIPEAYLLSAKHFLEAVTKAGKSSLIQLYEWLNGVVNTQDGWLYHAKGLWITTPGDDLPLISVIGLLNYTKRAYSLDLESNAIIITANKNLKKSMKNEIQNLMKHTKPMDLKEFEPSEQKIPIQMQQKGGDLDTDSVEITQEKTVLAIDENRRISKATYILYRLFGGSM